MMNETLFLYLFTRLDVFLGAAKGAMFLCALVLFMLLRVAAIWGDDIEPVADKLKTGAKWTVRLFFAGLLVVLILPSQRDMAIIVGGTLAIKAAQTPQAQELGGLVYEAVKKQLKKAAE
jgi:hypothetical protein